MHPLDLDVAADTFEEQPGSVTSILGMARRIVEPNLERSRSGTLFRSETGSVLTASHVGHYLVPPNFCVPLAKFSTHDLRRTVATRLVDLGVPLDWIAALLGHQTGGRDTRILLRHYVRSDLVDQKKQVLTCWDAHVSAAVEAPIVRAIGHEGLGLPSLEAPPTN